MRKAPGSLVVASGLAAISCLVEGVGVGAGDGDLLEEGEADVVVGLAEGGDLFVGAGLLAGEVVGGEGEDLEAVGLEAAGRAFRGRRTAR